MQYVVTTARGHVIERIDNCDITARTSAEQNCLLRSGTPCFVFHPRIPGERRRVDKVSLINNKLVWEQGSVP